MQAASSEQTELNKSVDVCIDSGSRRSGRRLRVPPFLNKVYELVNDPNTNAIISWSSGGTRFTVWDHHVFSKTILPRYFRHDVFSSFVYQLNNYGFKMTSWDFWEYENQWFQQGKECLLVNIKRKNDTYSPFIKRSRGGKRLLDSDNLIIEDLARKQEIMEKQIHSLIKQQKIVISMISAFVPEYAQQMVENAQQRGKILEAEIESKAIVATQSMSNENVLARGNEEKNTSQLSLFSFGDAGTIVPSSNSCSWSLMEDMMMPTEQWGYLTEFMEFPETKPETETKPALVLQGEEKKQVMIK